jgi:hypothetical protein
MNKKLLVSILAGGAAIFVGQVAFAMYQAKGGA